jgi:hypothetical protein
MFEKRRPDRFHICTEMYRSVESVRITLICTDVYMYRLVVKNIHLIESKMQIFEIESSRSNKNEICFLIGVNWAVPCKAMQSYARLCKAMRGYARLYKAVSCWAMHEAYNIQYTIYNIQHTIYNIQHTAYNIQDKTCSVQHTMNDKR